MQNRTIHAATAKTTQLMPYKPADEEQFWCRELDGSYTLRTSREIMDDCQPGNWQQGRERHPYFVRA